jgi:hypothetical protein
MILAVLAWGLKVSQGRPSVLYVYHNTVLSLELITI